MLQLEGRSSSAFVSCCLICPFAYEFQLLLYYYLVIVIFFFVSSSIKKSLTIEKAHGAWESSDDSRNKLMRVASTSKLISKVAKNADKYVLVWYIKARELESQNIMKSHNSSELTGVYARTFCIFVYTEYLHNLPVFGAPGAHGILRLLQSNFCVNMF